MIKTYGYALTEPGARLKPFAFERRSPGANDVLLEVSWCGICHSDLLSASNSMGRSIYPMVPGHEIVGKVVEKGAAVTKHQLGDLLGIGCIIDSCRHCSACEEGDEHYCEQGFASSFNGRERDTGKPTYGGYSKHYVIDENYAVRIPTNLDPARAAPLLCGGITTYRPLKRYLTGKDLRVGVLGLGGLGHLGIKFAKAMGASPVMLTSTANKTEDALRLGAESVILTGDKAQMAQAKGSLDFILNTISAPHDPNMYLKLLKRNGIMCLVGMPEKPLTVYPASIIFGDKALAGSLIGGIRETEEMLQFAAANGIAADVEIIPIDYVNEAWERMDKSDVKYRFVIDMASLALSQENIG